MVIINETIINNFAAKINAKEKQSNKITTISSSSTDTQYPSAKAVYTALQNANDGLFFKTKNGSTSNYINLFEIRPTGDYQAKPITFEIVRNTKPTPIYVSVRLTNVTLASNDYSVQVLYAWGTSDTPVYIRKEADNVFNVIVFHNANEEISVCNMNNPNQSVKLTPLGTVYGTAAPATSGDNQVWTHTYTVGGTTFGTGTNNVIRGNDSRLSDTRNPKSTKISAGSDLNTYTTTGFYYNNANTDCATITPLPQPNKAFFLQVEDWGTSNYTKQTITHYDPVKTYERIRNAGTWTDWYELQHNDGTGGENLLRTEPNNEGNSGIAYTIADETFHNDKVYYRNETSQDTTKYSGWTWPIPKNEFDYGDIFTLSFYAKGTNGAEIRTYFAGASGYISNRRISSNSDIDNNVSSYGDGATRFHLTSDWQRYYVTYKLNSTATTPTQNKSIHIRTFGASTDIEFYISNVKLERGYYATDYNKQTKDNEPLYFPTEVSLPTTTTSANRRKFIHPPYKFKNTPNWTIEGELKVTGNCARFDLHKVGDTTAQNFIAIGKNTGGNLAYWWSTSASAESSKTYDASHIAVDTWYPFRISRMGNNVLFMFNNTDKYELTTTYFNTIEEVEPTLFGWNTSGASVRNLKITPLEPVHPLSPSSSVCTNAQGIITTEAKNNHTHSDTQLNWNGGAMVNSASPLDMCLNEELSPNRLAYLDGNNIDVDYSTDGGSTWTSYGASATEKSKLVTTTQTFISGKGATASRNNQLRITIHSGLTSGSISQVYLATRKLMIYYSTGGGSGNKVKIQTNTYGSPDTWTDVKEYNIGGYSGWNSFPLNITFGGFANQTNTTRIKSIRLIFTITSNHNFNVQKIRLYGENCYVAQSDYAKTGHIYTVDILKNVTFPAKIIKEGGTSSQYLMANGDVQNNVTSWSNTPSDSNVASEKLVKDSLDGKQEELVSGTNLKTLNGVDLLGEGDIAIDVSCGGSTVIFEDDCSSVSGLSNYGSSVLIRGTNAIATISYDSTDNCYALTGSGNYHSAIPIPVLNDKDNYSIEADFKCGYNNELTTIGFVVRDYNDTSIQSTSFQLKGNGTFRKMNYTIGLDKDYTGEIISYSPYTYWVHMRLEITGASVKVELSYDGTIFKTYNYTTETITNRQVGLFLFCERGSTNSKCWVKNIKAEYLCESSTIIFEDDCNVDNSSTLFGNSVVLRNSGANTTAWNNGGYYTIQNTKGSSESMRVIAPLTGFTGDFTLEYDSYVESTDGASGFVIYDSSTSFIGLQNDGNNYGFFYNDGSYHETDLGSGDTKQKWVHFKFIVQGTNFTLECYENDVLQYTTTQTIHFNRSSSTMYGFEVKWTVNRITRYKNIVVKTNTAGSLNSGSENTIYLGDDIMTMIDTALGHMITNWEDYE